MKFFSLIMMLKRCECFFQKKDELIHLRLKSKTITLILTQRN